MHEWSTLQMFQRSSPGNCNVQEQQGWMGILHFLDHVTNTYVLNPNNPSIRQMSLSGKRWKVHVFACVCVYVKGVCVCACSCLWVQSVSSNSVCLAVGIYVHQKWHVNTLPRYSAIKKARKHFKHLWRAFEIEVEQYCSLRGKELIMLVCLY